MKNTDFYKLFLNFVQDLYDVENQIVQAMPEMIQNAKNEELKKGLSDHLEETKQQVTRLKKVFELLGEQPQAKTCPGIKGLIQEAKEVLEKTDLTPAVKDCFIVICAQQIEHFEIASYGSAVALVKHFKSACPEMEQFEKIRELLDETLQEEGKADKKLTKVAEGKMFMKGINDEIEKELKAKR